MFLSLCLSSLYQARINWFLSYFTPKKNSLLARIFEIFIYYLFLYTRKKASNKENRYGLNKNNFWVSRKGTVGLVNSSLSRPWDFLRAIEKNSWTLTSSCRIIRTTSYFWGFWGLCWIGTNLYSKKSYQQLLVYATNNGLRWWNFAQIAQRAGTDFETELALLSSFFDAALVECWRRNS